MLRAILNLLLIAAIVSCPLRCLAGLCPSSDACCSAVKNCCAHCTSPPQDADNDSDHPSHAPLEPSRSGGCQCICSGALVGASGILLIEPVQQAWLGLLVPDALTAPLGAAAEMANHPPDLVLAETGQSRCILYRALLL